jgi:hypothetical protein
MTRRTFTIAGTTRSGRSDGPRGYEGSGGRRPFAGRSKAARRPGTTQERSEDMLDERARLIRDMTALLENMNTKLDVIEDVLGLPRLRPRLRLVRGQAR